MATGTGLKKETSAALAVLLGPTLVVPILFILLEKDEFVRFWAFQSIVTFAIFWVIREMLAFVPFVSALVFGFIVFTWLIFTYKAWQGEKWEAPLVGSLSTRLMGELKSK